jgi:methyl-accepting chemotaxis protein
MLKRLTIARKLPLTFAGLASVASLTIGLLSYNGMYSAMEANAISRLEAATETVEAQFENALTNFQTDLSLYSTDFGISSAMTTFSQAYGVLSQQNENPLAYLRDQYITNNEFPLGQRQNLMMAEDKSTYSMVHGRWHQLFSNIAEQRGYYDIFLIDTDGNLVYSYAKEDDFGTNLFEGRYRDTDLARVAREALNAIDSMGHDIGSGEHEPGHHVAASEFSPYAPSNGAFASFMAAPVLNGAGMVQGVIAAQLPTGLFEGFLSADIGLGVPTEKALVNSSRIGVMTYGFPADSTENDPAFWQTDDISMIALNDETGVNVHMDEMTETQTMGGHAKIDAAGLNYGLIVEASYDDLMATANRVGMIIIIAAVITAVIITLIGIFFARSITRPLAKMRTGLLNIVAQRDLSTRLAIDSQDEVGNSANAMDEILSALDEALGDIRANTDQVKDVADQMSDAAQSMATNAEVQSSAVEELSSSVEQTAAQVRANADSARQAQDVVTKNAERVETGKTQVQGMVEAMDAINTSSKEIGNIIKVIDEIAFQTNLLALNAAVEAARAGQHGRGFAVVAAEVRNLAGRSAKAARETSELIDSSAKRVEAGVEMADLTSATFEESAGGTQEVLNIMGDISSASEEQARGVDQINSAISDISRSARDSSSQAEELAATAAQLTATNRKLREQVRQFQVSGSFNEAGADHEVEANMPTAKPAIKKPAAKPISLADYELPQTPQMPTPPRNGKVNGTNGHSRKTDASDFDQRGFGDF